MCRYKKFEHIKIESLYVEGNHGGDYIKLIVTDTENGLVHLEIGNCCVMIVDAVVPIEFITSTFANAINGDLKEHMKRMWPTEYGKELAEKIEKDNVPYWRGPF